MENPIGGQGPAILPVTPSQQGFVASTAIGTRVSIQLQGVTKYATFYFDSKGATAGAFIIEEAPFNTYGGTWSVLGTVTVPGGSGTSCAVFHCPAGAYGALGARLSGSVVGGTVISYFKGN